MKVNGEKPMIIGIMGAMPEEVEGIVANLQVTGDVIETGKRKYYEGLLEGMQCVVVFSRWGKVAAAATATHLILDYKVDIVVFTGVAGAVATRPKIGDVVVAKDLFQHDMDARPLFERHEIPLLGMSCFPVEENLRSAACEAVETFLHKDLTSVIPATVRKDFGLVKPRCLTGTIVSGDKFFASKAEVMKLRECLPHALCVEMEGAAVAQVCHEYETPFLVLRTVSDEADESAGDAFSRFVQTVAAPYSAGIIRRLVPLLRKFASNNHPRK